MRFAVALCLLLAACADTPVGSSISAGPEPVWQKGSNGWVYGRSPLHLWPAGHFEPEIVRIPDRLFFEHGSSTLDSNGWLLAFVQAQRLRQLPNHDVVLRCAWSFAEEQEFGTGEARALAAGRCSGVLAIYRELGIALAAVTIELDAPSPGDANDEAQRSVLVTAVATGRSSKTYERPEFSFYESPFPLWQVPQEALYDESFVIFFPNVVFFARDQAELSANARSLLKLYVDAILPSSVYEIVPKCFYDRGELGGAIESAALAERRCHTLRSFLIQEGLCGDRVNMGGASKSRENVQPDREVSSILYLRDFRLPGTPSKERFAC